MYVLEGEEIYPSKCKPIEWSRQADLIYVDELHIGVENYRNRPTIPYSPDYFQMCSFGFKSIKSASKCMKFYILYTYIHLKWKSNQLSQIWKFIFNPKMRFHKWWMNGIRSPECLKTALPSCCKFFLPRFEHDSRHC